ncbi:MAG: response regulator [Microcoleaceae cyanobacterium]
MPNQKPKLLIVDDEQDNLDLIYRTFRRQFQVLKADSPTQAMDILEAEGEIPIVLSDQSMPEMTGIEFLRKVNQIFPKTICMLLTGYSEEALESESENDLSHIDQYISKPWNPTEFKTVIQEAFELYQSRQG